MNMHTSKILYQSNINKLTYKYVGDNGSNNWWKGEDSDLERYKWFNKYEWNNVNNILRVQILL